MSGWNTIQKLKRIEEQIDTLGFKFSQSRNSHWSDDHGALSLVPKDHDSLPIYSRDAELFIGSLERLEDWLAGVKWARDYDTMLNVSDDGKRARKEQDVRNKSLLTKIKESK
jgi:hypothetical protein